MKTSIIRLLFIKKIIISPRTGFLTEWEGDNPFEEGREIFNIQKWGKSPNRNTKAGKGKRETILAVLKHILYLTWQYTKHMSFELLIKTSDNNTSFS